MSHMLLIGQSGSINPERVLMIVSLRSAPVKRLLKAIDPDKIVNMTYGYPQRSLVIFDNGFVAITRHEVEVISTAIRSGEMADYDPTVAL